MSWGHRCSTHRERAKPLEGTQGSGGSFWLCLFIVSTLHSTLLSSIHTWLYTGLYNTQIFPRCFENMTDVVFHRGNRTSIQRNSSSLPKHLLRVGWRNLFFQLCCCVSFLVSGGKQVLVLLTYVSRLLQYSCGVVLVFWFWWEIVFGITYVLSVQYTCAVVSVFWMWQEKVLWWEIVLKMRTPFDFL